VGCAAATAGSAAVRGGASSMTQARVLCVSEWVGSAQSELSVDTARASVCVCTGRCACATAHATRSRQLAPIAGTRAQESHRKCDDGAATGGWQLAVM
jgi:hypothetical protein